MKPVAGKEKSGLQAALHCNQKHLGNTNLKQNHKLFADKRTNINIWYNDYISIIQFTISYLGTGQFSNFISHHYKRTILFGWQFRRGPLKVWFPISI